MNRAIVLPLAAALLAACSSSSSSNSSPNGGGGAGGTPSCGQYVACSLVDASAVGNAFGSTFSAGTESDPNAVPSADKAELVQCNFAGTGAWNVQVTVRCCPCDDNDPQSLEAEDPYVGQTSSAVTGVGDSAFWNVPTPDGGGVPNGYALYSFVGQSTMVVVNVTTPSGTAPPLTGAEQIAKGVIGAL